MRGPEPDPIQRAISAGGGPRRRTFLCDRCGKPAETVSLERGPAGPVFRYGFGGNSVGVTEQDAAHLEELLDKGAPAALYAFRPMYAASFCPECGVCYCLEHWAGRHGAPPPQGDAYSWDWAEYGACPRGHERVLRDL